MSNFLLVYKEALKSLSIEVLYPNLSITNRSLKTYNCHCPFHAHNSEEGTGFIIFQDTKRFKCLSCGISGDPVDYQYSLNLGFFQSSQNNIQRQKELMLKIIGQADLINKIQNTSLISLNNDPKNQNILEDFYRFCQAQLWIGKEEYTERSKSYLPLEIKNNEEKLTELKEQANLALNYLITRGFTEAQILDLKIGFYPSFEYLRVFMMSKYHFVNDVKPLNIVWNGYDGYLSFPWRDVMGNPSTCYFRYPDKNVPEGKRRLCALKGENTKSFPLFLDRALQVNQKDSLVAVEGIIDVYIAHAWGLNNIIGYVNSSFSNNQLEVLKQSGIKQIYINPDNDLGGKSGTKKMIIDLLNNKIQPFIFCLSDKYKDLNDLFMNLGGEEAKKVFQEQFNSSINGIDWLINYLMKLDKDNRVKEFLDVISKLSYQEGKIIIANKLLK